MITYGSQIRGLYGRVFPRVFGADAIGYEATVGRATLASGFPDIGYADREPDAAPGKETLWARLRSGHGAWINLFRRTDPLGWRVFSDNDSDVDLPVLEVPTAGRGDPGPVIRGHSDYQHTPRYRDVVCGWTGEIPFEATYDPDGVSGVPTIPRG
jgi:hypothetical protein